MNSNVAGLELRLNRSDLTHQDFGARLRTDVGLSEAVDVAIEKLRKDLRHHLNLPAVSTGAIRAELAESLVALLRDPSLDPVVITQTDHSWDSTAPWDVFVKNMTNVSGILKATALLHVKTKGCESLDIPRVMPAIEETPPPMFGKISLAAHDFVWSGHLSENIVDEQLDNEILSYVLLASGCAIGQDFGEYLLNGGFSDEDGYRGLVPHLETLGRTHYGPVNYQNLVDQEYSVIAPYRQSRECFWLAQDKTANRLRKITDPDGRPIFGPNPVIGEPDLLLGKPMIADASVPEGTILFGDFGQFLVRYQSQVTFEGVEERRDVCDGERLLRTTATFKGDGFLADDRAITALTERI
jgi:hypothetical protein